MRRSRRLQVVIDVIRREEDQAARRLGQAKVSHSEAEARLQSLHQYRAEYENSLRKESRGATDVRRLQVYQTFISNLGSAIEQQTAHLDRLSAVVHQHQQEWARIHARRRKMEEYVARCSSEEAQADEKVLQRMLDDAQGRAAGRTLPDL